ncbi:hypothetical protein Tco_1487795 [Tanacetum coccineum]
MTPESIRVMIDRAILRNSTNGDGSHSLQGDNRRNVQTARPCFYADFMKCQPLNFKGTKGVVGLTRWIEKMESVFNIKGCAIENQVEFATCTLLRDDLTWWNGQIRTLGPKAYAMTWEGLKKKITDMYCLQGEIQKLEVECGAPGYFKWDCPKLKNKDGGNGNAQGWVYTISAKKEEDKSKGKQIKDVSIVQDFPDVFPEDLSGLPPTRLVEF